MNFQQPITTTVPQALLIRHWHNYFENGQTRRIKNLTYSLMPVDHNAIVRKTLLSKGGEGHRERIVFAELISIPTRCPPHVLVLDAEGLITDARIASATRTTEPDARLGLELLASKEVGWITHVACHSARSPLSNSSIVACHTQPPTLAPQHPVACHTQVAGIQEKLTPATGMSEPDVNSGLELLESKEVRWITHVACHTQPPTLAPQHPVACHTERVVIQGKTTTLAEENRMVLGIASNPLTGLRHVVVVVCFKLTRQALHLRQFLQRHPLRGDWVFPLRVRV